MTTKRVTFTKVNKDADYVDARYAVTLDGQPIGEVVRDRSTSVVPYAGRMYGYPVTSTKWSPELPYVPGQRRGGYIEYRTRIDAATDLVMAALGIPQYAARRIVKGES